MTPPAPRKGRGFAGLEELVTASDSASAREEETERRAAPPSPTASSRAASTGDQKGAEKGQGFAGLEELITAPGAASQTGAVAAESHPNTILTGQPRAAGPDSQAPALIPPAKAGPPSARRKMQRPQVIALLIVIMAISLLLALIGGTKPRASKPAAAGQSPSYQGDIPGSRAPRVDSGRYGNVGQADRLAQLKAAIDLGRLRISSLESTISNLDRDIESLKGHLTSLKLEIEQMESDARAGIEVDDIVYSSTIASHNALVPRYNQALQQRRLYYSQYQEALSEDRSLVGEYNSLIR